jgi:hypothetical protein
MIDSALHLLVLLASREASVTVWGRFDHHHGPMFGTFELIILGGVTLLLAATIAWQVITKRPQREFKLNSPNRLFSELCRAHRLDRANRRLLKKLAVERGLKNASLLFVEPEQFDVTNLTADLRSSAAELRQLRHKLFD